MSSIISERKFRNVTGDLTPPIGYVLVAREGQAKTFSNPTNVAYGANGHFAYKVGVQGTILFNPATFGGDPLRNVEKGGFAEITEQNQAEVTAMAKNPMSAATKWLIIGGISIVAIIITVIIIRKKK